MSYVKVTNGAVAKYPYSVGQLRRDNPSVSFPRNISVEIMARYGMHPVTEEVVPDYNQMTQKVVTATTPTQNGDSWVITRTVVDLTADEIADQSAVTAEANRETRNYLLAQTDYFALSDVIMSDSMQIYRQALRDITSHANWPNLNDDDWPVKP